MPDVPNRVLSDSPGGVAWNKMREAVRSHAPAGGPGALTSHTVHGTLHEGSAQGSPSFSAPASEALFPFRVYNSPADKDWTEMQNADRAWRTYRVRAGVVFPRVVSGTDDWFINPDAGDVPDFSSDFDIIIPKDATTFYFWLEINSDVIVVRYGDDPTAEDYTSEEQPESDWDSENPWEAFDTPDGSHLPIAKLTLDLPNKSITVRQYLRADVLTLCPLT